MREQTPKDDGRRDWMRLAEAAALLAVSPSTLRRWGDAGKVACRRTPGGQRRFDRAEIESWIAKRPLPPSQACSLRLDDRPSETLLAKARANPNIIQASVNA